MRLVITRGLDKGGVHINGRGLTAVWNVCGGPIRVFTSTWERKWRILTKAKLVIDYGQFLSL